MSSSDGLPDRLEGGTAPPPPPGTTYFVDPQGDDGNLGTAAAPLRTISRGLALAAPGDLIRVRPGTYAERIVLKQKHGAPGLPIVVLGEATDPTSYPIVDGGDAAFSSSADQPAFLLSQSSWLSFERLRVVNATKACFALVGSSYIVLRRVIMDFHAYGILLREKSHHVLVERCEAFQQIAGLTWSQLKGSKWEGGAFVSFGGAGMNVIRFNHIHDVFNGVYLYQGSRTGAFYDANVWIYRNRFERVVDDPFEPETSAFNNHFFHNTLINTHRMISLAPVYLGPLYGYNNLQLATVDITGEAGSGRRNSAFKVELDAPFAENGVYLFNNSVDVSAAGVNGYGLDLLATTVRKLYHYNNAYRTEKPMISDVPKLVDAELDYDIVQTDLGCAEAHGVSGTEPGFLAPGQEDFHLTAGAASRGKGRAVVIPSGFAATAIIAAGTDLGAYVFGESDLRALPAPVYLPPPGGEDPSFGAATYPWPTDVYGGVDPPCGPKP